MKNITHQVDFCVIGGGIAGICAALAAAREGVKTVLVHDRPVLGGNASSEIRMWICGAHGNNNRETGIVEELLLENLYRNPEGNYSVWDSVLYGKVRYQENLTLLLNSTCTNAEMYGKAIRAITAWELNSEAWHRIEAKIFCDCSGDSILAPLTGAEFRSGREAASEFGEDIAPSIADDKTMGMSCLIQARETTEPHDFIAPGWANKYDSFDAFPNRGNLGPDVPLQNYWWLELGGMGDALHDSAANRDELLKVCFGLWDLIKNHPDTKDKYRNWELEWVGFLPGKRESRRYVGDLIMTQNEVRAGGKFHDIIAYGGWSMDDHYPEGLHYPGFPTVFHPAPSPYGIPYRCLYSKNIANLLFAGRNISVTHSALSSTRVMATCGTLGQAAGTAAAIAVKNGIMPRDVLNANLEELQQILMNNDSWLPGLRYKVSDATATAELSSSNCISPEGLRAGVNRPIDNKDLSWHGLAGDSVTYSFAAPTNITEIRLVLDSDLNRKVYNIIPMRRLNHPRYNVPETLAKSFKIEYQQTDGKWLELSKISNNHNRLVKIGCNQRCVGIKLTILENRDNRPAKIFAFDFN